MAEPTDQQRQLNKFAKSGGKSGCMGVLAVVVLLVIAAVVTVYVLRSGNENAGKHILKADKSKELVALSENPSARFWKVDFSELTSAEQVFVCIWELEAEVNNGGFEQYFHNSSGDNAQKIVASLQSIGANLTAKIVQQAIDVFGPSGPPADQTKRQEVMKKLSEEQKKVWNKLDTEFFGYPNNLTELLHDFVMMNRRQIQGLGK